MKIKDFMRLRKIDVVEECKKLTNENRDLKKKFHRLAVLKTTSDLDNEDLWYDKEKDKRSIARLCTALEDIRVLCRSQVWKTEDDCTIDKIVKIVNKVLGND